MKTSIKLLPLLLIPLMAASTEAAVIVTLNPVDASYAGGTTAAGGSTQTGTTQANGLTFNITFTPTATDLTGYVTLMEIGGQTNGTGMYLLDGVPVFVGKQGGGTFTIPDTVQGSPGGFGVAHSGGSLTAGVETVVAAIYNPVSGALSLAVGPTPVTDMFTITDPQLNWNGNNSLSVGLRSVNAGDRAGTFGTGQFDPTAVGSLQNALGASDAYYWNDAAATVIPEPSTALLGGLGLLGLIARRRRN